VRPCPQSPYKTLSQVRPSFVPLIIGFPQSSNEEQ
jgi:hypothetical protein